MGELAFNGFLLLSFVGLAVYSAQIPIQGNDFLARYWPMGILIGLIVLMSIKICNLWKNMKPEERQFKINLSFLKQKAVLRLLAACAWLVIYSWMLPYVGYLIATFVFCVGIAYLLKARNPLKTILAALCITLVLFAVFTWGLGVSLPRVFGPNVDFIKRLVFLL